MPCPQPHVLQQLLDEALPTDQQATIQTHLESCPACQDTLERLAAGGVTWDKTAQNLGAEAEPMETALLEAVDKLQSEPTSADQTREVLNKPVDEDLSFLQPSSKPHSLGRLDEFEILSVLGKGGFGIVLKAFDESLHRIVAIKVMAPQLAANGAARARFVREARAAAPITHENVVTIHKVSPDGARVPYLAMQFVSGVTLNEKIDKAGPLGVKEILRIGMQAAEGLAAAHKQGLVHRDIKPGNILLENGVERVKITDFGLARSADDASVTQSGTVAGTPMYMSPEQANGEAVDHRSDLFSLGSVLYAMCTGHPPFRASGTHAVLKRVIDASPRPIREINPDVPEWLCDIIAKLHAKKPEDRFQTAKEVAELLGQRLADVQAGREIGRAEGRKAPVEVPATDTINRPLTRHHSPARRWKLAGPLVVLTLLVAGVFASPFLYRYFNNQGTLIYSGNMDPNLHKILVKQNGVAVAELTSFNGMVHLQAGDYEAEVVCKAGYKLNKFRVGPRVGATTPDSIGWQNAVGESFPLTLPRADHVSINVELAKLPVDPSKVPLPESGWVKLFNGKDLTGWRIDDAHYPGAWRVDEHGITCSDPKLAYLFSNQALGDFHLRIEAKASQGANFGIAFRHWQGHWQNGEPRGYVFNPLSGDLWLNMDQQRGIAGAKGPVYRPGAWFLLEIIVREERVKILVDGNEIIETGNPERDPKIGNLALRVFGNTGQVHFRKIEIKERPPEEPGWVSLFNGKDLTGWVLDGKDLTGWNANPAIHNEWGVIDGQLVGNPKGKTTSLRSKGAYENFHLRVRARISREGIASVNLREQLKAHIATSGTWGTGSLFQKGSEKPFKSYIWAGPTPDNEFTLELRAEGPSLSVRVNYDKWEKVSDNRPATERRGPLELEVMPKGIIIFKRIEIKELPPEEPGWMKLFNGKDFSNWDVLGSDKESWQIAAGVLAATGKKGCRLVSQQQDFRDFRLRMEMMANAETWANLMLRSNKQGDAGYRVELGIARTKRTPGSIMRAPPPRGRDAADGLVEPNEWFTLEIIAKGNRFIVKQNDKVALEWTDDKWIEERGAIAIVQAAGCKGLKIRKLEIQPLEPDK